MGGHDGLHDRETKAYAARASTARLVRPVEAVEDVGQNILGNANPVVRYLQVGLRSGGKYADVDRSFCGQRDAGKLVLLERGFVGLRILGRSSRGRVLDGVVDQVDQHL